MKCISNYILLGLLLFLLSACVQTTQQTFWWGQTSVALDEERKGNIKEAEKGYVLALGRAYRFGLGDEKTADSLFNLGAFYCRQNHFTPAIDNLKKALELYDKVSDPDSKQIGATLTYLAGAYVDISDNFDGRPYANRLRELGKFYEDNEALFVEGILKHYEIDLKQYEKDISKFKPLADAGDAEAQYQLANTYYDGPDGRQLMPEILSLLNAAAEQDVAAAQFHLGVIYDQGQGVEINKEKAREYYRIASENSHSGAQWNYHNCLREGIGGSKNKEESLIWLKKSADQGNPLAQKELQRQNK